MSDISLTDEQKKSFNDALQAEYGMEVRGQLIRELMPDSNILTSQHAREIDATLNEGYVNQHYSNPLSVLKKAAEGLADEYSRMDAKQKESQEGLKLNSLRENLLKAVDTLQRLIKGQRIGKKDALRIEFLGDVIKYAQKELNPPPPAEIDSTISDAFRKVVLETELAQAPLSQEEIAEVMKKLKEISRMVRKQELMGRQNRGEPTHPWEGMEDRIADIGRDQNAPKPPSSISEEKEDQLRKLVEAVSTYARRTRHVLRDDGAMLPDSSAANLSQDLSFLDSFLDAHSSRKKGIGIEDYLSYLLRDKGFQNIIATMKAKVEELKGQGFGRGGSSTDPRGQQTSLQQEE